VERPLTLAAINLRLFDETATKITTIGTVEEGVGPMTLEGDVHLQCRLSRLGLYPGRYLFNLEVCRPNDPVTYLWVDDALYFEVQPAIMNDSMWAYDKEHGIGRIAEDLRLVTASAVTPLAARAPSMEEPQSALRAG
jgi:hypothetical protein